MRELIKVVDEFCPRSEEVRVSALQSGFGSWRPNKGEIGTSVYDGMSFWGKHSFMLDSLTMAMKRVVLPNNMFFRVTNTDTESAYVHSDREWGSKTCIAYLSKHDEISGTFFYRHRETGLIEMPTLEQMKSPEFEQLKKDIVSGGKEEWEEIDFVRGLFNRAVIFHAPLFHGRYPKNGIGASVEDGRMIWACHFHTDETVKNQ